MKFVPPLKEGYLIRRYRRFLADIVPLDRSDVDESIMIHCPNTGSMKHCMQAGGRIWYQPSDDPKRKTAGSWILAETPHQRIACVNTHLANSIVLEGLRAGRIVELAGFSAIRQEVPYGEERSRIDFCLDYPDGSTAYLEVKSVTLGFEDSAIAAFPDSVTERGRKHLRELSRLAAQGTRTILLYCLNLSGVEGVRVASEIDPQYGEAMEEARRAGVEILAYGTTITPESITLDRPLKIVPSKL